MVDFQFLPRSCPLVMSGPVIADCLSELGRALPQNDSDAVGAGAGELGFGTDAHTTTLPSGRPFSWLQHLERAGSLFTPAIFSATDRPQPYRLGMTTAVNAPAAGTPDDFAAESVRGSAAAADASIQPLVLKPSPHVEFSLTRAYHDFQPGEPVPRLPLPLMPLPRIQPTVAYLQRAFAQRPVWTMEGLAAFLAADPPPQKYWKHALPAVAYTAPMGAFRQCWLRLGYDPRTDPDSRVFQLLDAQ